MPLQSNPDHDDRDDNDDGNDDDDDEEEDDNAYYDALDDHDFRENDFKRG